VAYYATPGGTVVGSGPFAVVTIAVQTPRGEQVSISQLMTSYTPAD